MYEYICTYISICMCANFLPEFPVLVSLSAGIMLIFRHSQFQSFLFYHAFYRCTLNEVAFISYRHYLKRY